MKEGPRTDGERKLNYLLGKGKKGYSIGAWSKKGEEECSGGTFFKKRFTRVGEGQMREKLLFRVGRVWLLERG